jgi:6-phosphogluconolactonase (cycloisomerase 2 family)
LQIVVDRSGRFAYVGNLQGDDISVFSIDPVTGVLSAAASPAATSAEPISLVVIDH